MYARESAVSATEGLNASGERPATEGVAPMDSSALLSPERKRAYDLDHDGTPLIGFSDGDLDDTAMHHAPSGPTPGASAIPSSKKSGKMDHHDPPAPIPELPKVGEDMVSEKERD